MLKKKTKYYGPASQELLEGSAKTRAWFDKQNAEFEASLTDEEKRDFQREKAEEAFRKKYVLRSEYETELKLAKSQGRMDATIFCLLVLPIILIALFWILRLLGFVRPGDFGIS